MTRTEQATSTRRIAYAYLASSKATLRLSVECDETAKPACVADVVIVFFG